MRSRALLHLLCLVLDHWYMFARPSWVECNTLGIEGVLEADYPPCSIGKDVPHCKLLTFILV